MTKSLAFVCFSFCFMSCSTAIKPALCPTTEWFQLGKADAMALRPRQFGQFAKKCPPEQRQDYQQHYLSGYDMGLLRSCTFKNGLAIGRNGGKQSPLCPLESNFDEGYQVGRKQFIALKRRQFEVQRQSWSGSGPDMTADDLSNQRKPGISGI